MGVREAVHFSRPPPQGKFEIQSLMSSLDYCSRSNEFIRSVLHSGEERKERINSLLRAFQYLQAQRT
jgi:hypothetical protein